MKNIKPKEYTVGQVVSLLEKTIQNIHKYYQIMNEKYGCRFETFGEWKKENPTHRLASRNYPDDEYVLIISNYFNYFEKKYKVPKEENIIE